MVFQGIIPLVMSKETVIKLGIKSIIFLVAAVFGGFIGFQIDNNMLLAAKIENKVEIEQYRYDQSRIDKRLEIIEDGIKELLRRK
jgi:hypothetical protein